MVLRRLVYRDGKNFIGNGKQREDKVCGVLSDTEGNMWNLVHRINEQGEINQIFYSELISKPI